MFWGLIMEPQRRYTQKVKKAFHISMAALDLSTSSTEPAQVMCGFEGRNYLLCTLKKPDVLQCPLNLNFDVGSEVSFAANGRCHIHLTGYLNDDFEDLEEEEVEEEVEVEVQQETSPKPKIKRPIKSVESGPPSKKSKNGVVTSSQDQDDEDDSDDSDYIKSLLGKSLDEDEDDEDSDVSVDEEDDGEEGEEEEEDEVLEEEEGESSLSEAGSDEEEEEEVAKPKVNGVPGSKNGQNESQKKKKNKKNKEKETESVKRLSQQKNEQKKEGKTPNKENQTPKKRSLRGGVIVEDIKEGQGAPAKSGKFVTVFYEGRLKQNNKMFDSTTKGSGFSFRLGNGEVVKGWDVGVAGMKVGGKRRITCPPAMAYGQKGSPPTIPPNSTLVFDVELRKIN